MRVFSLFGAVAICCSSFAAAKSAWSFTDATVSTQHRGTGEGGNFAKEKLTPDKPLSKPVSLGNGDTLKLLLTTTEDKTPKRPHQAFLMLHDETTGLEESWPLNLKETGKAKLDLSHKDLPYQFLTTPLPVRATLLLASFGSTTPLRSPLFDLAISRDPSVPLELPPPASRYSAQPEIHHIFKDGPRSPPVAITAIFASLVFVCPWVLLGTWLTLGMNLNHVGEAFAKAPLAHGVFLGSILAMEGVFGMYYLTWNLFQTLPVAGVVGAVAFVSGSRALSEVQERRLAGKR